MFDDIFGVEIMAAEQSPFFLRNSIYVVKMADGSTEQRVALLLRTAKRGPLPGFTLLCTCSASDTGW